MLVPVTLSDLERWDARDQIFQADVYNYAHMVWPCMTEFGMVTEEETFFKRISHVLNGEGGTPASPNFLDPLAMPK